MKRKKGMLFSTSIVCPHCGMANNMYVSDNKEYAYQCKNCDEDFYSIECTDTVSDLYEITLNHQTVDWFEKNRKKLHDIFGKYNISFMGVDDTNETETFIDFGWVNAPNSDTVQNFTDDILGLLPELPK